MSLNAEHEESERLTIPYAKQSVSEGDIEEVVAALRSNFVTQGPRVEWFEEGLREATGARYAVAVSSGTAALHLACLGLDLGEGSVGVVPAITFAATANCLRLAGATVEFSDVDPFSGLASVEALAAAMERIDGPASKRALLPVSFAGAVCDLEGISELARRHGAFVIEDAAHSIGATYPRSDGGTGRSASCRHSDAAILSFHPVKHVCAGEGGAVLTNDETLARRARRLRSHGIERGARWLYNQVELGLNYRMTELQAALGLSQLKRLPEFLNRRERLARRYGEALAQPPFAGRLRPASPTNGSAWHLYVVRFSDANERLSAYDFLHKRGIRVQVHYVPVYRHQYYQQLGHQALPGAEAFYATCLSLPLYPDLSDREQDQVIEALADFLSR